MPRYVRWRQRGATYFFTVVTYLRRRVFDNRNARRILARSVASVRRRHPFDIRAFVLLPDHLHCIWTLPANDDDFPTRWRQIKSLFTRDYLASGGADKKVSDSNARQGRHGIWQPRYWEHRIRDEKDHLRHRDYIHLNPVRHEYVRLPEQWPWSSFHRHVKLGWLDPKWPGTSAVELPEIIE